DAKRMHLFAFDDRQTLIRRTKCAAVVGRIQLPPESRRPAAGVAEWRKQGARTVQDLNVNSCTQIGNGEAGTRYALHPGQRHAHVTRSTFIVVALERQRTPFARPADDPASRR